MAEINLVPEESRKSEDQEKLRSKITVVSIAILILTAIGAIVTLAFFAFYVSERKTLVARVEEVSAEINKYKSAEELLVVSKDKATAADSVLNSRIDFINFYSILVDIIPQRVSFSSIGVGRESVTFDGTAGSSADIAGLVSGLLSTEGSKIVSNVIINSLSANNSKEYDFSIVADLKE